MREFCNLKKSTERREKREGRKGMKFKREGGGYQVRPKGVGGACEGRGKKERRGDVAVFKSGTANDGSS